MIGPQALGASVPPPLSPRCCAGLLGSASALPEPHNQYNHSDLKKKKSRARAVSLSPTRPAWEGPTPAPSLAESLPVRFPAAPAAAPITQEWKGGRGSERDITYHPGQPDTQTRGPPLRTGGGAPALHALESNCAGQSGPGEGRGESASGGRGGPSGTSAGGGAADCSAGPTPPRGRPAPGSPGSAPAGWAAGCRGAIQRLGALPDSQEDSGQVLSPA